MRKRAGVMSLIATLTAVACAPSTRAPARGPTAPAPIEPPRQVPLRPETVDAFIDRASRADSADHRRVREEIDRASGDTQVVRLLTERLAAVGIRDLGTSLVIVGILGELRNRAALRSLDSVVWQPLPSPKAVGHGELTERDLVEMLASKAIEAVAYFKTDTTDALTLRVIREHQSSPVRAAAIDAYLYNHGDSARARDRLRGLVRPEDQLFLDRARRSRSSGRDAFNAALKRFYDLHPQEVAPAPTQVRKVAYADTSKVVAPPPPPPGRQPRKPPP
jgi:hypothetical protein